MDSIRDTDENDDLSTVAWVHEELSRSLDAAHKALRRHLKEADAHHGSDVDTVDPAVLRAARQQIHQGVGALELVGLPTAAAVLRATEGALHKFSGQVHKLDLAAVEKIEKASFALLDYVARRLAGKSVPTMALFPQYRAVQELAGADRIHPADLWPHDWRWHDPEIDASVQPRAADGESRAEFESQLLAMMRGDVSGAALRMSTLSAALGAGSVDARAGSLWQLAAAFFEGLSQGSIRADVYGKRVASRLLTQLRLCERGEIETSDRLAQDLLFFCAQAGPTGQGAPRLHAVRRLYGVQHVVPVDYEEARLGRFDPAWIVQARKRVAGAKDAWSAVAGSELHRLSGLSEQFSLVGESLQRLHAGGDVLARALHDAVEQTVQSQKAPPAELAMEVATAVLSVEATLEDAEFDHPEQGDRIRCLAARIDSVRAGTSAGPLEPWMEELYRRVSDRQTMGSVVQELRVSLGEAEKAIDQFFRAPADRAPLVSVPGELAAMRGVLSVLGMDQASRAVLSMRDEIDALMLPDLDPAQASQEGRFEKLAGNLGALGFLIDMLSVQPQLAKSLFIFDPVHGTLNPVMGRRAAPARPGATLIEQALSLVVSAASDDVPVEKVARDLERISQKAVLADQPALAASINDARAALQRAEQPEELSAVREQIAEVLGDFVATASEAVGLEGPSASAAPAAPSESGLEDDDEIREIFIEEAREVLRDAQDVLVVVAVTPSDVTQLTALRRAFHTLKGSSRMVGLNDFGEAAWACEQLYNVRLADTTAAEPALVTFTAQALAYLTDWVEAIAAGRRAGHDCAAVSRAADALRLEARSIDLALPGPEATGSVGQPLVGDSPVEPAAPLASEPPAVVDMAPIAAALEEFEAEEVHAALPDAEAFEIIDRQPDALSEPSFDADFSPVGIEEPVFSLDLRALDLPATRSDLESLGKVPTIADDAQAFEPDDEGDTRAAPLFDEVEEAPVPPPPAQVDLIEIDLLPEENQFDPAFLSAAPEVVPEAAPPLPSATAAAEEVAEPEAIRIVGEPEGDQVKVVGPLHISLPLFNIFLNEADELSRRLSTELSEWAMELHREPGELAVNLAHSLGGGAATVGFNDLSHLARLLEHALLRTGALGRGTPDEAALFGDAAEEIRRLLHQFAAGFLKAPHPALLQRLAEHEIDSAHRLDSIDHVQPVADSRYGAMGAGDEPADPLAAEDLGEIDAFEIPTGSSHFDDAPEIAAIVEPQPQPETEPVFVPAMVSTETLVVSSADPVELPLEQPVEASTVQSAAVPAPVTKTFDTTRSDVEDDDDIDAVDAVDLELFPIFEEEAQELLPQLSDQVRAWLKHPADLSQANACMRTLHTFKGGARLAGAMRLGEMAHRLETVIERQIAQGQHPGVGDIEALQGRVDAMSTAFEVLRHKDLQAYARQLEAARIDAEALASTSVFGPASAFAPETFVIEPPAAAANRGGSEAANEAFTPVDGTPPSTSQADVPAAVESARATGPEVSSEPLVDQPEFDWAHFSALNPPSLMGATPPRAAIERSGSDVVRVRAPLLERLVNQSGEVSIRRVRIETEVSQIKGSLSDLTDNLERLRSQLREIELQAETQISSRMEAAKAQSQDFDPLEMDRFTRFQELTRMMAESVNDVATVQRSLQRTLQSTEDELAAQARLTRDLQDDLLRTRMVEFDGLSDRLYRVVRQAAKETGKQVRLDIVGGSIEIDRGVLDRMTGSFEHLLRNCVTHGIETPEVRQSRGKDAAGLISITLTHVGNEVSVEVRDDGAGLDLQGIRAKGVAMNLLDAAGTYSDAELADLIFTQGFSTAASVTELAGRGIGMDVVRSEVTAMGGRIETQSRWGEGSSFRLVLPLTTAVTQVVMLRCADTTVAVPSTLVEIVRRAAAKEIAAAYESQRYQAGDEAIPFYWLGALLHSSPRGLETGRTMPVVVIRSAQQRIAVHVDQVIGNQEVVVKNLGPQLSRLPGLVGITLLASGAAALIYNPVALATVYSDAARHYAQASAALPSTEPVADALPAAQAPLVMVVDDSLTVRRVTQRLLVREGYRVVLAKDGLDALERLTEERPSVLLSDIEMPRMDGFDLVRNVRADVALAQLPVIMITSRIAQKHREYAAELGVDHYLGKPYSEEELLALVGRYTRAAVSV